MWLNTLRTAIETYIGPDTTLLIAVSGGGDSVALLRGVVYWQAELGVRVVVAHLDHGLRPDSAEDAAFVGRLAGELNLMCLRERQEVAVWAAEQQRNLEDAARQRRYALLEAAAQASGAKAIAVAHTADDQAETLLMHLFRGAGLDGLTGMTPLSPSPLPNATVPIFRPLLGVARQELRTWLIHNNHAWCEDSTNADTRRLRSAIRHRLLPFLEESFPRLRDTLGRTATLLADDAALLAQLTDTVWQSLATVHEGRVRFPYADFLAQPPALQRRLVRRAYYTVQGAERELGYGHVQTALALAAQGKMNSRATLPGGVFLTIAHDGLWVEIPPPRPRLDPVELPPDGIVGVGAISLESRSIAGSDVPQDWTNVPLSEAYLDAEAVRLPLTVRAPRTGDLWQPLGMGGQVVNLRDWMAKQKVPLSLRESLPLVVDANDNIVWVVGWRTGYRARITAQTRKVYHLKIVK